MTTHRVTPLRAVLGALASVALVLSGVVPAHAQTAEPPPPLSSASFCANVANDFDPFEDIAGGTFEAYITCLAATGITSGVGPGSAADPRAAYAPAALVTRQQMASFITRLIDTAHHLGEGEIVALPPFDGVYQFQDVQPESPHFEAVNRLAAAGIVAGGPGNLDVDQFGPNLAVSRGQMATFIHRAHEFMIDLTLRAEETYFTDTVGNAHAVSIDAVAANAIAVGLADRTYRPDLSVTRAQMSAFLIRTMASLEAAGRIIALPPATMDAQVYFLRGTTLEPEVRAVTVPAVATDAIEELLAGPTGDGLGTEIPAGTRLLGLTVDDRIATIDLSGEFETGGGTLSSRARVAQVVFTLTQFDTIDAVIFYIDGQRVTTITAEGLDVTDPVDRSRFADLVS